MHWYSMSLTGVCHTTSSDLFPFLLNTLLDNREVCWEGTKLLFVAIATDDVKHIVFTKLYVATVS